jgi:putative PIN family toxin of toxin-antitoxin system
MRVILDTNILVSALVQPDGRSAELFDSWKSGRFDLLYCDDLLAEFRRVSRIGKLGQLIAKPLAGRLVNDVKNYGIYVEEIPDIERSPDPWDNFLLALAEAGHADFLVTGDKAGLLSLEKHCETPIISVRAFTSILGL